MSQPAQNYENHAKFVPAYHYYTFAMLLALLVWSVIRLVGDFSFDTVMMLVLIVTVLMALFYARVFALGAQDRVIRLEERLRMAQLLPDDLRPRINEIGTSHLIALRFASDDELPDLTRKVLDGELKEPKAIKQAIKSWRADHQRL